MDTLARRFQSQAENLATATAVRYGDDSLTYQELDWRSNRLANYLSSCGVSPGDRVGLALERGLDLAISLLAVLKAGAAYVPFDPAYPEQRLQMMAKDSQVSLVLVSSQFAMIFKGHKQVQAIEELNDRLAVFSAESLDVEMDAEALGYLIYTSGSTGRPKGVAMPQRALLNLMDWQLQQPGLDTPATTLQFTPLSFDVHFQEFFGTWLSGGELVIVSDVERRDAVNLLRFLCNNDIERLFLPFVALQHLAEVAVHYGPLPSCLKEVVTAGEQLQINRFISDFFTQLPDSRLHNHYGPSETHVVTAYTLTGSPDSWDLLPPIGSAIANTRVYIVDEALNPVPSGDTGEICIAGDCLAQGYWQQSSLTDERFITRQIAQDLRLYRTGDMGKMRPDGNIDYLGRIDGQIKIRGYRIETGEIETAITAHPLVKSSVVVASGQQATDKKLLAYLVLNASGESAAELLEQLRTEQMTQWKKVWDGTYSLESATEPEFDISGWNSSYTGDPLTVGDMQSWVDGTVNRVRELKPGRVLEIGCGTGLIMYGLSPYCDYYHATDFSPIAIKQLENHLIGKNEQWPQCHVSVMTAEQMETLADENFDTIVMNSVTQHFPGFEYLLTVLQSACELLKNGGSIFLGDVTNYVTREAFFAELELSRSHPSASLQEVRTSLEKAMGEERELVLSPAFFSRLGEIFPAITSVEVQLKPGSYENELSRFRFDVVLHIADACQVVPTETIDWLQWNGDEGAASPDIQLRACLEQSRPKIMGMREIPNNRVCQAFEKLALLNKGSFATIADLDDHLSGTSPLAFEPQDFWNLEHSLPYKIDVSYCAQKNCFDVIARRLTDQGVPEIERYQHCPINSDQPLSSHASQPLSVVVMPDVVSQLRQQLAEQLPDYMLPQRYILLSRIPMTPSGKLDRRSLPLPSTERPHLEQEYVPAKSATEKRLAEVWSEVLELDRVGVNDNFFDLGGNSILSVTVGVQIKLRLARELAVVTLFQYPTIRSLAFFLDGGEEQANVREIAKDRARKQQNAFAKRGRAGRKQGK